MRDSSNEINDEGLSGGMDKYQTIFDFSPDIILLLDDERVVLDCNIKGLNFFSKNKNELIGRSFNEICNDCGINININEIFILLKSNSEIKPLIFEDFKPNKEKKWFELTPILNKSQTEIFILTIIIKDITIYKIKEEELKISEEYNKVLFSHSHNSLVVMDVESFKFLDCNDAASNIFGFKNREELLSKTPLDLSPVYQYDGTSSYDLAIEKVNETIKRGAIKFEWLHQRPNGELWDAEVHLMSFSHGGKQLLQFSIQDITDKKKTLQALIENEDKYKTLFESANDAIFLMTKEGFVDCNARTLQMFDSTREQIVSNSPVNLSPEFQPDGQLSKDKAREKITNAFSGTPQFFEWLHKKMDGTLFDAEVSLNRVQIKGSFFLIAIVRDISERKKTEIAIKQSEENFKVISNNSNDIIWIRDLNLKFTYISPSCHKVLGYTVEEAMELTYNQITTPEYVSFVNQVLSEELAREGKPGVDPARTRILEVQEIRKDGTLIWTQSQASFIRDVNGKITGILGVTRDITKQKLYEEALAESEKRFRVTAEKTGEIIFEYNITTGNIIWLGAIEAMTGYSVSDFENLGIDRWSQLIHPDDRQNAIDELEKAIVTNCDYFIEYRFQKKDGTYIHIEVRSIVLPGMQKMYGTMNNITERKRVEGVLRESEERFRITAEKTGELIYEYKINTGEIIWSGAVEAITGYTLQEFKSFNIDKWGELIHPDDRQFAFEDLDKAINLNIDYSVEYRFLRKDGEYIYVEDRGVVLPTDSLGVQRMYGTMNNITERKRNQAILIENERRLKEQNEEYMALNEELVERNLHVAEMYDELLRAKEKAEENDRLKSAFLANISHEIRTPMNGLIGFSELIIQPNLDDSSKKAYAEIINNSCNQLLSIINDVIDISKIETNQVKINESNVLINQLLYNTYQFFLPTTKAKNIQFIFDNNNLKDDILLMVDEIKLNQIINNLLNNALKFTDNGSINFGYNIKNDFVEFYVKDTGIGIEKKDFNAIFDRFRQVDVGITRNYGGTGLGLSISKAFIEKMGGKIWLDSKVNEGTSFYFTVPYKPIAKKEKDLVNIADKQFALFDTSILVAEDEDVNFMYIKILLESLGFNVIRAENGLKAVELVKSNSTFDIILMDIKMPVMGGIEATKIIKSINKSIPVIATTAYALSGEKDEFLAAGCDDYISKPLRPADLISVIKKFINKV